MVEFPLISAGGWYGLARGFGCPKITTMSNGIRDFQGGRRKGRSFDAWTTTIQEKENKT